MKEKHFEKVCTCTSKGNVVYIDTKLLYEVVKKAGQVIVSTKKTGVMVNRALLLGDICETSGHYWLAMQIWRKTMYKVIGQDWDDWYNVFPNPVYVRLEHVTNRFGAMRLGRKMDELWKKLKHPEMADNEYNADDWYNELWMEHYYESIFDSDDTIPDNYDLYASCSWINDIYHTKHVA